MRLWLASPALQQGCSATEHNARLLQNRSEGGDKVEAVLVHADGKQTVRAAVVDNTNGAYSLAFRLELQGEWRLTPHVNGSDLAAAAIKVHRLMAPLSQQGLPVDLLLGSASPP